MAENNSTVAGRLGVPIFLLVLTTVYVAATFQIRPQFSEGLVGPRFLPFLAATLMYGALFTIIWKERRESAEGNGSLMQPAAIVVATAAYIGVFKWLGYSLSTFLFVFALFMLFSYQAGRPVRRVIDALAVTAVFYGLFAFVFGIRLPVFPGLPL
ncbi:tripartite tricarboxylate transporter TctB family protein [Nitratireductor basaltis]|uniref:Tripartite tricarboxylate transporter TctB family protein n=1 Tax=Nitratireductor basaltis TaxID=472175 RepID=A0A084U8D6_9HYPH|nr:tripartite tricarboxylate transporter TctB family protein [Nitratireductor basaltis]KFB09222.1 Tripartite tricarboxylate transporter TctB family protein [Nitratireductor basaltis]